MVKLKAVRLAAFSIGKCARALTIITCFAIACTVSMSETTNAATKQKKAKTQRINTIKSTWDRTVAERNRSTVSVISGGISGTYIRFATDLANVLDDLKGNTMRVLPVAGRGGGQNVLDVLFLRGVDMGITQQDHLTFFKQRNPRLFGNIEKQIHYITKLYNAEFHLVANKSIKSVKDLEGKTVNLWRPWSATDIAGQTIFKLLNVGAKVIHIDTQLALKKVKAGEIAATVLLAGAPVKGYVPLKAADDLHFVPLDAKSLGAEDYAKLLNVYLPAKLSAKDYPGLIPADKAVPTIASGAMLAVYNWAPNTERYKKVARFTRIFFEKFPQFQKAPRHPKWKEINIGASVPGWQRFRAAQEWLDQNAQKTAAQSNPRQSGTDLANANTAFQAFLAQSRKTSGLGKLSNVQKKALFQQFTKWWNSQQR